MSSTSDSEGCVSVSKSGDVEVCVGERYRVVEEVWSLLGTVAEGEVFEVVGIESSPSGPEVVVEYDHGGGEYRYSPTTLGEALGVAEYKDDEACLERVDE